MVGLDKTGRVLLRFRIVQCVTGLRIKFTEI